MKQAIAKLILVFIMLLLFLPGMKALAVLGWMRPFSGRGKMKPHRQKWPTGLHFEIGLLRWGINGKREKAGEFRDRVFKKKD